MLSTGKKILFSDAFNRGEKNSQSQLGETMALNITRKIHILAANIFCFEEQCLVPQCLVNFCSEDKMEEYP